jgi:cellulose biosynthesis protein BcsQ
MTSAADNKSYVIWNNKGGVGKSTITFHIASVYAQNNPEKDIIVIDMCPQANSSMMLLGGRPQWRESPSESYFFEYTQNSSWIYHEQHN